jgi:hypothetical protein
MYSESGLSDVYEHFIDNRGIKYYNTYNRFYGDFIRQLKTPEGLVLDACEGKIFEDKMLELGFKQSNTKEKLFSTYDNWMFFRFRVYASNNGITNKPIEL